MQKTAVVYGLALSTLVAAFLLVPREKTTPVPPLPPPVPPSAPGAPITELWTTDGLVTMTARLDRGALLQGGREPLWLDIAIKSTATSVRPPLTTVLVVDRSGSMAGEKMDAARDATERYVRALRDGDAVSIVTFGTDVTVDLPLVTLDSSSRARAIEVARAISEGGGTNIDGGLGAARSALSNLGLQGRVARVVLVSDGRPTEGQTSTSALALSAQRLHDLGVGVSTLGLGLDYNEDLMERIAVDGGGRYHYLKSGDQLAKLLDDELRHATAVAAANVKIHLPLDLGGLRVGAAPGTRLTLGDRAVLDVGDLAAGEERHVLVRLDPAFALADHVTFAAPELTYRRAADGQSALLANRVDSFRVNIGTDTAHVEQSRRDDVRARVLQVSTSLELTQSMQAYAEGDVNGARQRLEQQRRTLEAVAATSPTAAPALAREAQSLQKLVDQLGAQAPSSEGAQDIIKAEKARAFDLRR